MTKISGFISEIRLVAAVLLLLLMLSSCTDRAGREDISTLSAPKDQKKALVKNGIRFTSGANAIPVGESPSGVVSDLSLASTHDSKNDDTEKPRTLPVGLPALADKCLTKTKGAKNEGDLQEILAKLNLPGNPPYRIHRGDIMDIAIPFEPESTRVVTVRPDGHIGYLYDIDILAAGLTYPELVQSLKKALKAYYYDPGVSVNSKVFSGSQVYVMGPVERPGAVAVQNSSRLLEVLSTAGVLALLPKDQLNSYSNANVTNDVIDLRNAYMMREGRILPIDFYRLLMKRDMRFNIFVHPDDFLFFPSSYLSDVTKRVYVCGAVLSPKVYTFITYGTFMSAIANSSGIEKYRADASNCLIIRKESEKMIRISYNDIVSGKAEDVELQDSDIVFIPERGLYESSRWSTTIINEVIAPLRALIQSDTTLKGVNMQNWSPASQFSPVDNLMWK